jgi:hypothetical protein
MGAASILDMNKRERFSALAATATSSSSLFSNIPTGGGVALFEVSAGLAYTVPLGVTQQVVTRVGYTAFYSPDITRVNLENSFFVQGITAGISVQW